jgi:hypothetical protein
MERKPQPGRMLARTIAILLCVSVLVFFSALLVHNHAASATADHAAHCQVCALGHTAAATATTITLTVALQLLMLLQLGTPRRGSPSFVAIPTTRPPPATF